ncbi:MAG: hypothetical protein KJ667_00020, partial [Alphaproteobacteria bacterium]|nr:hypothetical protein [Alphaproteobacteria bacterium]
MTTKNSIRTRVLLLAVLAGVGMAAPVAQAQQVPSAQPINRGGLPDYLSRWFPQWFGKEETGPRPEDTLQAPFANPEDVKAAEAAKAAEARQGVIFQSTDGHTYRRMMGEDGKTYALPVYTPAGPDAATGPLEEAHRRQDQIADWLVRATSEIFTMDSTN